MSYSHELFAGVSYELLDTGLIESGKYYTKDSELSRSLSLFDASSGRSDRKFVAQIQYDDPNAIIFTYARETLGDGSTSSGTDYFRLVAVGQFERDGLKIKSGRVDQILSLKHFIADSARPEGFGWSSIDGGVGYVTLDTFSPPRQLVDASPASFLVLRRDGNDSQTFYSYAGGGAESTVDHRGNVVSQANSISSPYAVKGWWQGFGGLEKPVSPQLLPIQGSNMGETLTGTSEGDVIYGYQGDDAIFGRAGSDSLFGNKGDDTIYGGGGDDQLFGNAGNDLLFGGKANDSIVGGAGDDSIAGGFGDDALTGGAGRDTFVFRPGFGFDTVRDFGDGDKLSFEGSMLPSYRDTSTGMEIAFDDGSRVLLLGVDVNSFDVQSSVDISL